MRIYEIAYAYIEYQNEKIIDIRWGVKGIGFGQLIIDAVTHEIIDDECMGDNFCNQIIDYVFNTEVIK